MHKHQENLPRPLIESKPLALIFFLKRKQIFSKSRTRKAYVTMLDILYTQKQTLYIYVQKFKTYSK